MVIYYVSDRKNCAEVRLNGFTDGTRMVQWQGRRWLERGVWFSDSPTPDQHQGWLGFADADYIPLAVKEHEFFQFEVPDVEFGLRRRWYVPASVANGYLRKAA